MRAVFASLACLFLAAPALAQEAIPPSPIVKTALVVDAKAGQPMQAGVIFTMPEHWHIYWRNPGDSGIPTRLEWTLPDGLTASDIHWPAPERIETSGLVNYGYSNSVTLPVTLTPARDDISGEIRVKASWLVCKEICIPESAVLSERLSADAQAQQILAAANARVPQPFTGSARYRLDAQQVTLTITQANPWGNLSDTRFSPVEDGLVSNNKPVEVKTVGNTLILTFARGTADPTNAWNGVLHSVVDGAPIDLEIHAVNLTFARGTAEPEPTTAPAVAPPASASFILALGLAFLGGLILNIMPCVLPILALKALAIAKKAGSSRAAAARQGAAYTVGVVASFLAIAAGMLALKASGSAIGWGFQLQNAGFVAALAAVMLLVAANLLGLFQLPVLFGARATGVKDDTLRGSLLTGVLAVLVATPCTAPFMATAIGATLSLPTAQALLVFAALGLGMASPFLLISLWPAARRLLPKPGGWMHRFKQLLAVPMLATAVWLLWVLAQLLSPTPMVLHAGHETYSAERLSALRAQGTPVLVDATAAWCLTCKVNERVALTSETMQQFFREKNVTLMVADWTSSDPAITAYLASFGRNGVPLYVYYPPRGDGIVLPQILTPSIVRDAVNGAHE
ncbi:MAG: protein-disulfide reductase DsbD domain-containing protein [Pseudomonadota bacterium]